MDLKSKLCPVSMLSKQFIQAKQIIREFILNIKSNQILLFSIKPNTMFLAYIGKYTHNENRKKRRTYISQVHNFQNI